MGKLTAEERAEQAVHNYWAEHEINPKKARSLPYHIATAITDAVRAEREACAKVAQKHSDFCEREARNGGSPVLIERAAGAWHIARAIEARTDATE